MKILVLNWKDPGDPEAGGAEEYVRRVAELWTSSGHVVELLVPRRHGMSPRETMHGVTYIREGSRFGVFAQARRHLRRCWTEYDAVLESVSTRPFFAHRYAGSRATVLYHQIADDVWLREFPFPVNVLGRHVVEPAWIRRLRDAHVVTVSPSNAADLAARGVVASSIVSPGVDVPAAIPERQRSEAPRLIFLGRLNRTKRVTDALQAHALLRERFPGATLDVAGRGYLLDDLRRATQPGVTIHGFVSEEEKSRLLMDADVMLLPGTREGWGIVAMEAAAHGVPVVAYDIPGLCDAVVHGSTGLLTAPDPTALARAAAGVLDDRVQWSSMRREARARSFEFSWQRTADRLLESMRVPVGAPALAHEPA